MFLGISSMIVASMIDTVYIGWIGTAELAAVSFTFPLVMAVSSVSMGLAMGATSIMSRIVGGGDRERCLLIGTHTLILVLLLVVVISILGYVYAPVLFRWVGAGEEFLAITGIPETDGSIRTGRGEAFSIGTESNAPDGLVMALERQ